MNLEGKCPIDTGTGDAFKIALKDGRTLDELEIALLPILPIESVRVRAP